MASFYASWMCHLVLSVPSPVFSPLLRLSPPPSDHDYIYNLDETEGLCDLFDVPILNLWPLGLLSEWEAVSQTCLSTFIFSMFWRWEEVPESQHDLKSVHGHPCTDTVSSAWAQSDSSSVYSLLRKYRLEQNILHTAFPRTQSQEKWQIIIFFRLLCKALMFVYQLSCVLVSERE